jgi:hypothetical protein
MRWADLPNAFVAIVWSALLLMGGQGIAGIKAQYVPGYPAIGQWILYVAIPIFFVGLTIAAAIIARRAKWFYDFYPFTIVLTGFPLFPVVMVWGGGV